MADTIKMRRDTAANWKAANPTLADGEFGIETDTKACKVGDGTTNWNNLEYFNDGGETEISKYIYDDVRLLAVGQTYELNESVKTSDKRLLKMSKEVVAMNITDEVAIGDLKTYDGNTYKAQKAVSAYNGNRIGGYSDGDCAFGAPAKLTLEISRILVDGSVTINFAGTNYTVNIETTDTASDVADAIVSALSAVIGWTFSNDNGVITATSSDNGDFSDTIFIVTGGTGTGVAGVEGTPVPGTEDSEQGAGDGTPTILTMTIIAGSGFIDVTIGETTNQIVIAGSTTTSSDIVASIVAASWIGWNVSVDSIDTSKVVAVALEAGTHSVSEISVAENVQGVSGAPTLVFGGSNVLCVYDQTNDAWSSITLAQYAANSVPVGQTDVTKMWKILSIEDLFDFAKQNSVSKDISDVKDAMFDFSYKIIGEYAGGDTKISNNTVYFFRQATLKNCLLQKIEFTTAYTGTVYIGFMNPANDKFVGKLRTYTLTNETTIDLNIEITDPLVLGIGTSVNNFLKYSYSSGGGVNAMRYKAVSSCVDGASMSVLNRIASNYNWRITIRMSGTPLPDKIEELNNKFTDNIDDINNVLNPVERSYYGVKGVGSSDLNKSSVWFYWKYIVSIGDIIESIEFPSNYTGEFILALGNSGSQKVLEVNRYTLNTENILVLNKTITQGGILGFGASTIQFLKRGSTNVGVVKYVTVSSIKVNSTFAGSYQYGDINIKINIKRILPTLEERVEALESNSNTVSKPYGEINIIPIHGQSLSLGILRSVPAIAAHKTPILGGLMFNTGIYQVDSGINRMQGIKNLAEGASTFYSSPNYETSCWGTAEMIKKRVLDKLGDNIQTFYLTCGQDGSSINEQFDSELQVMENAMVRVKELFPYKTVKIPCFCYIQGEADQSSGMDGETWKSKLRAGREAIQAIAERVLKQTTPVYCILYQTIRGYNNQKKISQAQMELCRDDEYFAPSTSVSTLIETPQNDHLHISNWGQYLLGQYQGIQFADWIYFGHKNVGVMPRDISISGNKITIKFNVAHPPLRFVTDWCTPVSNYGFSVVSNGSNIISPDGVAITDSDTVEITCSQNIGNGDILYYGISASSSVYEGFHNQGHHGNLCDSQGEFYTTVIDGITVALNNYCYSFYKTLNV